MSKALYQCQNVFVTGHGLYAKDYACIKEGKRSFLLYLLKVAQASSVATIDAPHFI